MAKLRWPLQVLDIELHRCIFLLLFVFWFCFLSLISLLPSPVGTWFILFPLLLISSIFKLVISSIALWTIMAITISITPIFICLVFTHFVSPKFWLSFSHLNRIMICCCTLICGFHCWGFDFWNRHQNGCLKKIKSRYSYISGNANSKFDLIID